jgi:protein SCO1/2
VVILDGKPGAAPEPTRARSRRTAARGLALLLAAAAAPLLDARPEPVARPLPDEGRYLYRPVPDALVTTAGGEVVRLAERWGERPVLLTLVFASCVQVCPPYLRSLREAVAASGGAGADYEVVVLSFDPYDTPESMAAVARGQGLDRAPGWTFGVAPPAEVERLSRAVGFWSRWDADRLQFDHPAMLAGIDRGRVVRLLVGAEVSRKRLREVLRELAGRMVQAYPLPAEGVLFRCFDFDPRTGGLALDWGAALLVAPGLAMIGGALLIFRPAGR